MGKPAGITRRRALQGGLGALALFAPSPFAWVWAQSEGATRLLRAPKRALILGNGGYKNVPGLRNPANDAKALAAALGECGFEVSTLINADRGQMTSAIADYSKALAASKSVGIFYFAGHGVQLGWHNYLLPVDASVHKLDDIPAQSIDVATLVTGISKADNPMNVIILDACRDNPFGDFRVEQRGLSQMDAPARTLLAYATAPGNVASDGEGANGLYTENLLREIRVRDAKIEDVFKRVRLSVRRATNGRQVPWESTSLEEDFYFVPPESLKKLSRDEDAKVFATERAAYEKARDARDAAGLTVYLQSFPSGRFTELAQLQLDQLLAAQGEKLVEPVSSAGNPYTVGTFRADTRFRIGDSYTYETTNRKNGNSRRRTHVVTSITDFEVAFDDGVLICDPLGNVLKWPNGMRWGPHQEVPVEYAVGKRWSTRFPVLAGGTGTNTLSYRVTAREKVKLPAGTFDAFRVEGEGLNEDVLRPPNELEFKTWRVPEIRLWIAFEHLVTTPGQGAIISLRGELVEFKQA
jgi:hypothetical protein